MGQNNMKRASVIKYLVVLIDDKRNFAAHLSAIKNKTLILHKGLKKVAGTSWGLSKNIGRQLHLTVVEKVILYASAAWAHNITARQQKLLFFYPKNVSAQYHRDVQHHSNAGSPGHRRSNASSY
ncbi:hypothetical protein AVEN_238681-1 [Araneus ventricosus]|uniref:Uncharacterized protein n=1 Tax=Araneus ventricosus TaxID=182803 RepID=A0A4Y2BXM1_ARAVE|nr:hypothetical protein AVEN_238681-1 [Araneus ventricosus]